jgi:hypothetical protein
MDNKRSKLSDKPELPTKLKLENTMDASGMWFAAAVRPAGPPAAASGGWVPRPCTLPCTLGSLSAGRFELSY